MSDSHDSIVTVEARPLGTPRASSQLAPIVAAVASGQITTEQLDALLAAQERWQASEAKRAYTAAMIDLKRDLPAVIARDATVDFTSSKGRTHYTHATLGAAVEAVAGPMAAHGFSHCWEPRTDERLVTVTARITHRDGHSESASLSAPADVSGNKSPAQAIASTVTLLERYTLLSLLGIATADMRDPGPPREEAPDTVDPKRNNATVTMLRKRGRSMADAERLAGGRKAAEWTAADREEIGLWLKGQPAAPAATPGAPTAEELAEDEQRLAREPGSEG